MRRALQNLFVFGRRIEISGRDPDSRPGMADRRKQRDVNLQVALLRRFRRDPYVVMSDGRLGREESPLGQGRALLRRPGVEKGVLHFADSRSLDLDVGVAPSEPPPIAGARLGAAIDVNFGNVDAARDAEL